jgi:hypothetical protein
VGLEGRGAAASSEESSDIEVSNGSARWEGRWPYRLTMVRVGEKRGRPHRGVSCVLCLAYTRSNFVSVFAADKSGIRASSETEAMRRPATKDPPLRSRGAARAE